MALILRSEKGSALSYTELDNNFVFLSAEIDDINSVLYRSAVAPAPCTSYAWNNLQNLGTGVTYAYYAKEACSSSYPWDYTTQGGIIASVDSFTTLQATNVGALAHGDNTTATGTYSHAEGSSTTAIGNRSHAEGSGTTARGVNSHAEGSGTTTGQFADSSHAEGISTTTENEGAHAEGNNTLAGGYASHAEGHFTYAAADWSHAEGTHTTASGW